MLSSRTFSRSVPGVAAIALLSACSGGGSGGGGVISTPPAQPAPVPTPAPAPAPAPAPTPAPAPSPSAFDTEEVRRSDGPSFHNALTPWGRGITGAGSTIAIIDTGIDRDNPEFAGRILAQSRDVAGTRPIDALDQHGTNVALIAAAAMDDSGIVGLAYEAGLLVLRADRPASCSGNGDSGDLAGCIFADNDIARGIDAAIAADARVINLSLGGGESTPDLLDAIGRATAAGIVIVVAAGNDGEGGDPAVDPDNPNRFARDVLALGNGAAIIVGSVNEDGVLSTFSNRAGGSAEGYLSARGERLCCVYEDGSIRVTREGNSTFVTLFSGTSFATPQVAGAVALLAQAFPNLTGQEIVEILLDTARDAGAAGTDAVYGRGILDLARAVAPRGATSLAGTGVQLALADDIAIASAPMGDALAKASLGSVVVDKYDRAYGYELSSRFRGAAQEHTLERATQTGLRRIAVGGGPLAMAFTLDATGRHAAPATIESLRLTPEESEGARVLAARVAMRIAPDTRIGIAFAEGADGIGAQLQGRDRPAFMIARGSANDAGFVAREGQALAVRHNFGGTGLTFTASRGEALTGTGRRASDIVTDRREGFGFDRFGLAADRRFGALDVGLGLEWLREERSILGAYLHDAFGARGADSLFVNADAALDLGDGWALGAQGRLGRTDARSGNRIADGSGFDSSGWALDLSRRGAFQRHDRTGVRLASPLRVTGGGLALDLPVGYDYASESAQFAVRRLSLAPEGRELMGEANWSGEGLGGVLAASAFYRSQPGHDARAPDDAGFVLRWNRGF